MAMTIMNNAAAQMTLGELNRNSNALSKSLKKVAEGMKIGSAQDDASGYSISEKMRTQLRGLNQDIQNAQNGQSMLKVAEGAVQSTVDILRTLKEKAINAANDTNTDNDRATIQKEADRFIAQIDDNAYVTYNNKYMLNNATADSTITTTTETTTITTTYTSAADVSDDDDSPEAMIIRGLYSEWFQSCLNLLGESFGMSFDETGTYVNEIDVNFSNEGGSTLAYVTNWSSGGVATKLSLTVNMDFYNAIDTTNPSGYTSASAGYLDRTLAHELTHAVMAANIYNFNGLPKYIKEGMAEMVHGIDDFRLSGITQYAQKSQVGNVTNTFNGTYESGSSMYSIGYTLLHYMAKHYDPAKCSSQHDAIIKFMQALDNSSGTGAEAYNEAVRACTSYADSDALETAYISDLTNHGGDALDYTGYDTFYNSANSIINFLGDYCGIKLEPLTYGNTLSLKDNDDTGSVTGSDMGGSTPKNAEDVVPETGPTSAWTLPTSKTTTYTNGGLTVIWPDEYVLSESSTTATPQTVVTVTKEITTDTITVANPFYYHTGTKANQNIAVKFADMRAEALGLRTDNQNVQLTTREKAQAAIEIFDNALEKALDEQTNIGALRNRLEYTVMNLTTASENTQGAESTIRDADMAKEMSSYTKNNVLLQASQSMLAQANQNSSAVLSLLQ